MSTKIRRLIEKLTNGTADCVEPMMNFVMSPVDGTLQWNALGAVEMPSFDELLMCQLSNTSTSAWEFGLLDVREGSYVSRPVSPVLLTPFSHITTDESDPSVDILDTLETLPHIQTRSRLIRTSVPLALKFDVTVDYPIFTAMYGKGFFQKSQMKVIGSWLQTFPEIVKLVCSENAQEEIDQGLNDTVGVIELTYGLEQLKTALIGTQTVISSTETGFKHLRPWVMYVAQSTHGHNPIKRWAFRRMPDLRKSKLKGKRTRNAKSDDEYDDYDE